MVAINNVTPMSTSVTSRISEVVVFKDRALVTRTGAFQISASPEAEGESEYNFIIPDLPFMLEDSTLRLKLLEARGAILRDVKLEPAKKVNERGIRPKKEELEKLERDFLELEAEKEDRLSMIEEIKLWINRPIPGPPKKDGREQESPRFPVAAYGKYILEFTERLLKAEKELQELEERMLTLEREIKVKIRLAHKGPGSSDEDPKQRWVKQLLVRLHCKPERLLNAGLEFQISYSLQGARWAPAYLLHQRQGVTRTSIDMNIRIAQFTGEDWQGVRLRLSGASLSRLIQLPDLPAQKLGRKQPPPGPALRPAPQADDELFTEYGNWVMSNAAPVSDNGRGKYPDLSERLDMLSEIAGPFDDLMEYDSVRKLKEIAVSAGPVDNLISEHPLDGGDITGQLAPNVVGDMEFDEPAELADLEEAREEIDLSQEEHEALYAGSVSAELSQPRMRKLKKSAGPGQAPPHQKSVPRTVTEYIDLDDELQNAVLGKDLRLFRMCGPEETGRGTLAWERGAERDAGNEYNRFLANQERIQEPGALFDSNIPYVYECAGLVDVASDGHVYTAGVESAQGEARIEYRSAPAVNTDVFRRLVMENPFKHPLPPGRVSVYMDGAFAFHTNLNQASAPGARLQIPLGREEALRVARNTRYKESSSGVFAGNMDLDYEIENEVRSQLAFPVNLELIERLPVKDKDNKEIGIRKVESKPEAESIDEYEGSHYKGGVKFLLELGAGEKATARLLYRVTVPAKKELKGGNRR